ncbi:MAG TPA: hypothetical protein VFL86_18190 [Burkholderiaceae bacterium]|nr:hypothetical protein [Burkholderiaceae bacterium]
MIFVLEPAAPGGPRAWFAYDGRDLLRKAAAGDALPLWQIHDCVSPRELLEVAGATPATPGAALNHPALWALALAHGWDTALYRADHLRAPGSYGPEPVTEAEAAAAALRARGPCRIYWTEAEATAAFEQADDPLWHGPGWRARWALREQLVALDVLAEDL